MPSAVLPGFSANVLPASDEGWAGPVSLGFTADFFGAFYSQLYVNTNGNVTFGQPLSDKLPYDLTRPTLMPIIAPFFADVDTTGVGSGLVTYGTGSVGGHAAFGVTWPNVGYYNQQTDKLNTFQLVLIAYPETGPGNFDIEFNYDKIQWDTSMTRSNGIPVRPPPVSNPSLAWASQTALQTLEHFSRFRALVFRGRSLTATRLRV
jgi:hypothetical protein